MMVMGMSRNELATRWYSRLSSIREVKKRNIRRKQKFKGSHTHAYCCPVRYNTTLLTFIAFCASLCALCSDDCLFFWYFFTVRSVGWCAWLSRGEHYYGQYGFFSCSSHRFIAFYLKSQVVDGRCVTWKYCWFRRFEKVVQFEKLSHSNMVRHHKCAS